MHRHLLTILVLAASACGTTTGTDTGDVDTCRCDNNATLGVCDEVIPASASAATIFCGTIESGCAEQGGTYSEEACPTASAVGACFDDQADDTDKPFEQRRVYYSLGEQPFDAASAEAACDENEVFQTSW